MSTQEIVIEVPGSGQVSGLIDASPECSAALVLAHGAGAGMRQDFMEQFATRLLARGIAVLRFQFPFMQKGSRRPDTPAVAQAAVRAAVELAGRRWPGLPLFAGGKSFGGRMTSQAQSVTPLAGVKGLVFVGFPLHSAGSPAIKRAQHLDAVTIPMLFLQGNRDELAESALITQVTGQLPRAEIVVIDDADHAFHVRRSSGTNDAAVHDGLADSIVDWIGRSDRTI